MYMFEYMMYREAVMGLIRINHCMYERTNVLAYYDPGDAITVRLARWLKLRNNARGWWKSE